MAQRWFTVACGSWEVKKQYMGLMPGERLRVRRGKVQALRKGGGASHKQGRRPEQVV